MKMKKILAILIMIIAGITTAQTKDADLPETTALEEAQELAFSIDKELSLTEKQLLLVEKLNKKFIDRRNLIVGDQETTLQRKNKLLQAMYVEQGNEMGDILTRPQLIRYQKIRGEIQPMLVLEDK
jgi:hypothetical protein